MIRMYFDENGKLHARIVSPYAIELVVGLFAQEQKLDEIKSLITMMMFSSVSNPPMAGFGYELSFYSLLTKLSCMESGLHVVRTVGHYLGTGIWSKVDRVAYPGPVGGEFTFAVRVPKDSFLTYDPTRTSDIIGIRACLKNHGVVWLKPAKWNQACFDFICIWDHTTQSPAALLPTALPSTTLQTQSPTSAPTPAVAAPPTPTPEWEVVTLQTTLAKKHSFKPSVIVQEVLKFCMGPLALKKVSYLSHYAVVPYENMPGFSFEYAPSKAKANAQKSAFDAFKDLISTSCPNTNSDIKFRLGVMSHDGNPW